MASVGNVQIPEQTSKVVSFKADEHTRRASNPPMLVRQPMNDQVMLQKMMEQQEKERKKAKRKNNIITGISIASGLAIIAMVGLQFLGMKGNIAGDNKAQALKKLVNEIKDSGIKREAEEELARQSYERNLYRVEDLITLDKLAQKTETKAVADLNTTKKHMDTEIIGMEEAKQKIMDYLKGINYDIQNGIVHDKPIVLCLDGPPGTGKSSLVKEVADALGMYFKKVSLGGAEKAEEITGFARTYVGSTPGVIAKAQLEGNTKKVVYGFDEVEKAGGKGILDALLPILDNQRLFTDKYYNAPIDLSQSIFMLTTNEFHKLPPALRSRVQVVKIAPYTLEEKAQIAEQKLLKELKANKMNEKVEIAEEAYEKLAEMTTDQGGRQVTQFVDNLIQKLKGLFVEGETQIKVDNKLIDKLNINTVIEKK